MEISRVTDEVADSLLANPQMIETFLFSDEKVQLGIEPPKWQFWKKRTSQLSTNTAKLEPVGDPLDLDKAWHGIHFLLTGLADEGSLPEGFLLCGEPVGNVDVGYGPAKAISSNQVAEVAILLSELKFEDLVEKQSDEAFRAADIYPFQDETLESASSYLNEHFNALQGFVLDADKEGHGLIVSLT